MRCLALSAGVVLGLFPTQSQGVTIQCAKPLAPYCAKEWGPFDTEIDAAFCEDAVMDYLDEMRVFLTCVSRGTTENARRIEAEGALEARQILSQFECRLAGEPC